MTGRPFCCPNAADDHDNPPAGDRPGPLAAQEPRASAVVPAALRSGACLLSRGWRRALHGRAPARRRPCRPHPPRRQVPPPRPARERSAVRRVVVPERRDLSRVHDRAGRKVEGSAGARGDGSPAARASLDASVRRQRRRAAAALRASRLRRPRRRPSLDETFRIGATAATSRSTSRRLRLRDLLTHLYVLVPVLDAEKHYWVGDDGVEKAPPRRRLARRASHDRELINRYSSTAAR